MNQRKDYTGHVGPQSGPNPWPMYSFERPAYLFWNGVANHLRESGQTDEHIKDVLQSKSVRWMLDTFEREVEKLGHDMAAKFFRKELMR